MAPIHLAFAAPVHLGFSPFADFAAEVFWVASVSFSVNLFGAGRGGSYSVATIYLGFATPVHLGFAPFADFAAEGVRVASV